jgi:hypothetical protein
MLIPVPQGNGLLPFFESGVQNYALVLPGHVTEVQFISVLTDDRATILICSPTTDLADCGGLVASGDLSQSLSVSSSEVNVTVLVTAESSRTQATVVRVRSLSSDSALSGILSPIGEVQPAFASEQLEYVLRVPSAVALAVPLQPVPRSPLRHVGLSNG